jgi:diguanylate cyclase (GGDEF)-like protein/putative nucleotidyltransferase with HDIG domain
LVSISAAGGSAMNRITRAYIAGILLSGLALLVCVLPLFHPADLTRFAIFFAITLIGSGLKVRLPGVTGTMSVYFLLALTTIMYLTLPEVLVVGIAATVFQCYWHATQRPRPVQVAFNAAASSLAVAATYAVYHSPYLDARDIGVFGRLAIGSVVMFLANTAPVALVIALTEQKNALRVWRESYFWYFPYYLVGASIAAVMGFLSERLGWFAALSILPVAYVIYRSYRLYIARLEDEKHHVEQVASLHLRTIQALALAIDAKDHRTHDHLRRVQTYALQIAKELNLTAVETEALQAASLLHDIGKLAVPEHIISKPGRLTPEEFEKMKIHPIVGAEILAQVEFPYPVVPIVRAHHEKWDGSGYPDGLRGEEIPIGARILAVVDCLDALASDRRYRRALPLEEAMKVVESESGKAFDPRVVDILSRRHREFEHMAQNMSALTELGTLSTDVKVERGEAPAAGFEGGSIQGAKAPAPLADALNSIASARQEAQGLFELAQALGGSLRLSDTLSMAVFRIKALVPYDALALYLIQDRTLKPEFVTGEDSRLFSSLEIPMGEGLSGWVAESGKAIVNGNPSVEPGYLRNPHAFSKLNSALAVPLRGANGLLGVLALYHASRDAYSRTHLRVLQAISSKLAVAVENARQHNQGEASATIDALTSLPNLHSLFLHLEAEITRAAVDESTVGLIACDLNRFSEVNARFGHLLGNRILGAVASTLRSSCRANDYLARAGGDEFVVVMPGLTREFAAERMREFDRIVRAASKQLCGEDIVSLSCGDAYFPGDGRTAEELLAEADRHMYQQKMRDRHEREPLTPQKDPEPATRP